LRIANTPRHGALEAEKSDEPVVEAK
jgi:hypothetical protein